MTPPRPPIGRRRRATAAALAAGLLSLAAFAGCGVRPQSALASGSSTADGTATVAVTPAATASSAGTPTPEPTSTFTVGSSPTPTAAASSGTSASTSGPPLAGMVAASGAYDKPSSGGVTLAPTASGPLSGRTVEVDPGHNGVVVSSINNALVPAGNGQKKACNTSGTEAVDGTAEHVMTWAIGVRLVGKLRSLGATVVLTRPSDGGVGPCVNERAAIANRRGVDLVLSIHGDGALVSGARGFHVIVSTAMADSSLEAPSVAVAKILVSELEAVTPLPRSTYVGEGTGILRRDDIAGVNLLSGAPGVMLEVGNLRNAADWSYLKTDAAKEAIALALAATAVATLS